MKVRISEIKFGRRFRSDLGDIDALAESIAAHGLLHPIVITAGKVLVCGYRRLAACRLLKHDYIEASVVALDDPIGAQTDENTERKPLTMSERVAIAEVVELKARQAAKDRQGTRTDLQHSPELGESDRKARESKVVAAKAVGLAAATLAKAQEVVTLAEEDPARYQDIKEKMDATGNVSAAHRELKAREREAQMAESDPEPLENKGKYSVVLADPPWTFEDGATTPSRSAANQYPLMSLHEIKALPVPEICENDCALFLWVPNSKAEEALQVMQAWGFKYKTNFAWVKDRIGLGSYNRQRHELLFFGTKGNPGTPPPKSRHDSVVESPREEHSKKPDQFYDIIEAMYPWTKRIELFARTRRERWSAWGYEAPKGQP